MIEMVALAMALQQQSGQSVTVVSGNAMVALQQQANRFVTVVSGDTLSSIAMARSASWQALCAVNRISDCNDIYVGQRITIPVAKAPSDHDLAYAAEHTPAPPPPPPPPAAPAPVVQASVIAAPDPAPRQAPAASYSGSGGFQSCVISRESGGNSQVMNSTGHYGLYQFSSQTWAAYGGDPGSFGNASVAQQNQVFANAMATPGGSSNWSPYDGC
jgi:hypothetical protein